jgi:hypothetical protein
VSARRRPAAKAATTAARALSRRRFVGLLAAGSAAMLARHADAAAAPRKPKPTPRPAAPATAPGATPSAEQKEFERQRANTLSTLKTLRAYPLPPGGDLAVVFRPLPSGRRSR